MADRVSIPATALRPYRHAIVGRRPDGKVLAIQVVHIRRDGDRLLFGLDDHTSVSVGVDETITVEDWSDHLSPGARAAADAWVPDDAGEEVQDSGLGSLLIIVGEACAALGVAGPAELPEAIAKVLAELDRLRALPDAWVHSGHMLDAAGVPDGPILERLGSIIADRDRLRAQLAQHQSRDAEVSNAAD